MGKQRILVIDDDETVTTLLQGILEWAGYEVRMACNAAEANRYLWEGAQPALIILDVMMPFLSGEKVAEIYRANEATRDIPILYVSGKPEAELQALVERTGAGGYLHKPFAAAKVVAAVQGLLG
ncbi:response regulator [Geomonas sp. Red69]|uniref:Response regulator n=1 Tax=Geomonas diazotrophica TaxID=2843197 RepID=A0ABX8JG73_9BACT|nr:MULTISPECIES: response regulator [Geomonas]MBU5638413.1 response regulator [Geomonas diazotrophica]QWV97323.1 response regulator [Geomonas nitrogeniifigens]QXE86480.1 response regulator [Geomonas nitrogeniifigens]